MALESPSLHEFQFTCPICLDLLTDPVSIPCGHNFCKNCLGRYWDQDDHCRCPLCKEDFPQKPELRVNCSYREMVDVFRHSLSFNEDLCAVAEPGEVTCDVCGETKAHKALKSCLVCLASYCGSHLQPHRMVPALQRHKLIEPVENLAERLCKAHERKLLELFCQSDQTCVCQCCSETEHKDHHVVTLSTESKRRTAQVRRKEREVELMIQDREKRIEELHQSVEDCNEMAVQEMELSVQIFTDLMEYIDRSHNVLLEEIEERRTAAEKKVEGLVKELEEEIAALKKTSGRLQELSHTEDPFTFLQRFDSACTLPPTKSWSKIHIQEVDFVGCVRSTVSKVSSYIDTEMNKLSATELKKMQTFAVDIMADPNTASPWILISEDGKEIRQAPKKQKVPDSPKRFTEDVRVLAKQGFESGRHYWEVGVHNKANWVLGVSLECVHRKVSLTPCPEIGMWTLIHKDGRGYSVVTDRQLPLYLCHEPRKVGVFLDYDAGQVSFFNAETECHLYSYADYNFNGRVYPIFDPCVSVNRKDIPPLRIINRT